MPEKDSPLTVTEFLCQIEATLDKEAKIGRRPLPEHTKTLSIRERQLLVLRRIEELGNQTNMAYAAAADSDFSAATFLSEYTGTLIHQVLEIVGINAQNLTLQQRVEIQQTLNALGVNEPKETVIKHIEGYIT